MTFGSTPFLAQLRDTAQQTGTPEAQQEAQAELDKIREATVSMILGIIKDESESLGADHGADHD